MAYADKSSDMRRVVISKGGHVIWEGVRIDDAILLVCREQDAIWFKPIKEIEDWIEMENSNLFSTTDNPYILLYKDSKENEHWNVKEHYIKELTSEKRGSGKVGK